MILNLLSGLLCGAAMFAPALLAVLIQTGVLK